jgi:integrase
MQVTSTRVTEYKVKRQEAGAAAATINRELSALRRMFSLAVKAERLQHRPHVAMLREDNARKGFFEEHQYLGVRAHLPKHLQPVTTFAYITGWRIRSEILPLTWSRVDFKAGVIRLDVNTTKSGEGREFVMTPTLRATLEAQRATTEAVQKKYGIIIPFVFHRYLWNKEGQLIGHGHPIQSFYKAWKTACRAAGCPGRIVHDFRRTAVRNLERAGVPRSTAMRMVGHRTMEIYDRYAITDHAMLQEGSAKLAAYLERSDSERVSEASVTVLGKVLGKVGGAAGGAALLSV